MGQSDMAGMTTARPNRVAGAGIDAAWSVRMLFQTALVLFVFTVVVGILNGTDAVDFGHETLMTHVHAGTLGWISLCVLGAALVLFGGTPSNRRLESLIGVLPVGTAVAVVAYVIAFFTTTGVGRPITGTVVLLALVGWFGWVIARSTAIVLSVPRLAVLAALASLALGAVLGVLLGVELSGEADVLPEGGEDAHPASMVIGFLIPVGMALGEWLLRPGAIDEPATRRGYLQVGLPFVGGVLVMAGLLADVTPLVALSLPFEVVGVGIFVWRMWPELRRVVWTSPGYQRSAALTTMFLVINIGLFVYLIVRYEGDLAYAPQREILALDHVMFIGVMTNSLFGLVNAQLRRGLPAWTHHVIVVATNVGLVGFALGLMLDETALKRAFTPVLGGGILVAVVAFTTHLHVTDERELAVPPATPG